VWKLYDRKGAVERIWTQLFTDDVKIWHMMCDVKSSNSSYSFTVPMIVGGCIALFIRR
jgi:hypothetical protein